MHFRPDSYWDRLIIKNVLTENEYKLPDDMSGMNVIDIGAHIGSFAVACINRGIASISCFEPDHENYKLLEENLLEAQEGKQVTCRTYNAPVTGKHYKDLGVRHLSNHDFGKGRNTGHVDVFGEGELVSYSINEVLKLHTKPIDLLKIDCEGAEWEIFDNGDFKNVQNIMAELHACPGSEHASLHNYRKDLETLARGAADKLKAQGFNVQVVLLGNELAKMAATRETVVPVQVNDKPKLLWVGDAVVPTGYGRVTEQVCTRLQDLGWDVSVLGIGYSGDPHRLPFDVYPAMDVNAGFAGMRNGSERMPSLTKYINPNVVLVQDDNWNVGIFVERMAMMNIWTPTVGYIAVDSENVRHDVAVQLRNLKHAICHTQFGIDQLKKAGFTGPTSLAGHGVNTDLYFPCDRNGARAGIELKKGKPLPDNAFIWGVVAANSARKRLDLTISYFAEWFHRAGKPENAFLFLHTNWDGAYDLTQLADYCGIRKQVIGTSSGALSDQNMPTLYSAFDVMLSTSEGESWGLTHLEGMACGVPQIAVRCGGLPSWAGENTIYWVQPSYYQFTGNRTNTKRRIASEDDFVRAMEVMYESPECREAYSNEGYELAQKLTWENVAKQFDRTLRDTIAVNRAAIQVDAFAEFK